MSDFPILTFEVTLWWWIGPSQRHFMDRFEVEGRSHVWAFRAAGRRVSVIRYAKKLGPPAGINVILK